jgi:hypothetical protein
LSVSPPASSWCQVLPHKLTVLKGWVYGGRRDLHTIAAEILMELFRTTVYGSTHLKNKLIAPKGFMVYL